MAAFLGLLAAAALPPLYAIPLLISAFTGLVRLIDSSRSTRSAFTAGWWFGLGYFLLGLCWIAQLGLGQLGILDAALPSALKTPALYARLGNRLIAALVCLVAVSGLLGKRRRSPPGGEEPFDHRDLERSTRKH